MTLDLYRISQGLSIESADFSSDVSVLFGTGTPGGDAGVQDAASIGSLYLRTDAVGNNLQLYYKKATGGNSSADWAVTADQAYIDSAISGMSWREPALVLDSTSYADITAAETAANVADTVDGITITVGDRLLFTNLTSGNDNVYIVSGSSGAWTFTEDTNLATAGDALLITQGTNAETQWVYDGSAWIQFATATSSAELGYIRTFIGKSAAGAETPTYSSTNVVTNGTSLETAIGSLDGSVGTRTYTDQNYVTNGDPLSTSIDDLDIELGVVAQQGKITQTTNVTTQTAVDSIPVAQAEWVKWMVMIVDSSVTGNRRFGELDVITDGTNVDYNDFGRLKLGTSIAGLSYSVDVNAGNLRLLVSSTSGVNVTVKRLGFGIF